MCIVLHFQAVRLDVIRYCFSKPKLDVLDLVWALGSSFMVLWVSLILLVLCRWIFGSSWRSKSAWCGKGTRSSRVSCFPRLLAVSAAALVFGSIACPSVSMMGVHCSTSSGTLCAEGGIWEFQSKLIVPFSANVAQAMTICRSCEPPPPTTKHRTSCGTASFTELLSQRVFEGSTLHLCSSVTASVLSLFSRL